ncbi:MAG: hypothetical protein ACRELE_02550 [Gemmatimonadales bacterium]
MTAIPQPGYVLTCGDPAVKTALHVWLDASRLAWPGTIHLDVDVVDSLPVRDDPREEFPQPGLLIQAGPPDDNVRIRWTGPEAEAMVHATEPRAVIRLTREAAADLEPAERGFLLVALLFVLRRVGWYHIHCAALRDPRGRDWLFVGESRSGKSTTSAFLAGQGWSVSTDDIGFLIDDGTAVGVRGFCSPIALRDGGQSLLGTSGGLDFSRRGKAGFFTEDLGGRLVDRVSPQIILFPSVGEATTIEPIAPRAVINSLIASSLWVLFESVHAQEHLDLLSRLAAQSMSFRATLGPDLFANPSLLLELVP